MRIVAEFRASIAPAIPEIIALLVDEDENVRWEAADSLTKFAERGKIPNLVIGMADTDCS